MCNETASCLNKPPHANNNVISEPMPNAERIKQMRQIIAGIDKQLSDSETQLLESLPVEEIHKIVDRIVNLKVANKI